MAEEERFEFVEGVLRIERGRSRTYVEVVLKPGLQTVNAEDFGDKVAFSIETAPASERRA